jgi:hypothetical protein
VAWSGSHHLATSPEADEHPSSKVRTDAADATETADISFGVAAEKPVKTRLQAEVQEESHFELGRAEIIENLSTRSDGQLGARFDLYNQLFIDNHVDSLNAENVSFIRHVDANLSRDSMAACKELSLKRHHIDVLEKPEAKCVVDLKEGSYHGACKLFLNQIGSRHTTRCSNQLIAHYHGIAITIDVGARSDPPLRLHRPHPFQPLNLDA